MDLYLYHEQQSPRHPTPKIVHASPLQNQGNTNYRSHWEPTTPQVHNHRRIKSCKHLPLNRKPHPPSVRLGT
uniref:Uncharacterized protein n=1 Tax=Arundo donax TaxID=35708 RepID=A0A0A9GHS4_ARUDO